MPNLGSAASGVRELTDAVTGLMQTTARATALVPRIEALVGRIERIADAADQVIVQAEAAIDNVDAAAARAGHSIDSMDATAARADAVITRADATLGSAQELINGGSRLLEQTRSLLGGYAGPLAGLAPAAGKLVPAFVRVAETVSEQEVDAVVGLIDQLPEILDKLKRDIIPLLDQLGPDVHATMEIVDDVRHIVNGLPGAKLFRRRGEEADDEI